MIGRFNRAAIKTWQHDITRIPHELNQLNATILQNQASSRAVEERVENEARVFIRPIASNIKALESQIEMLENNQVIQNQKQIKISQQAILDKANPELSEVNNALSQKISAVGAIKYLQQIKIAQAVMQSHPKVVAELSPTVNNLRLSLESENLQASSLGQQIDTLRGEISALEYEEALDRQRHARENAHHHHEYHEHHGHHGHHDHHHNSDHSSNLVASLLGAVASAGEFVIDIDRGNRLSSKRNQLKQAISQQFTHYSAAGRYAQQYNEKKNELVKYQNELNQQQAWLVEVNYAQKNLAEQSSSSQLSKDLDKRTSEQQDLERQQAALKRKIDQANDAYRQAQNIINRLENKNTLLLQYVDKHSTNTDSENLNQQLQQAKASRVSYDAIEAKYLAENAQYLANITDAQNRIQTLTALFNKQLGNRFLTSLRDAPQNLITDFVARYKSAVTKFDAEHPADQSDVEQAVLIEMNDDYAAILAIENHESVEGQPQAQTPADDGLMPNPVRIKLYQLCGMLHAKMAVIKASEEITNSPLFSLLRDVTEHFPLDPAEALAEYEKLARPRVTPEHMAQLASEAYAMVLAGLRAACGRIRTDVKELRKLSETAIALADAIDSNKSHVDFNILFYTKVLIAAMELLMKPSSAKLRLEFEALTSLDKLGLASNCKRSTGVAFLFLGAATLAISALAEFGYIDDIPEMAKKAGYGVGGAGVAYGLFSLFRGREHGSVKASHNFSAAASHVPSTLFVVQSQPPSAPVSRSSSFLSSSRSTPKSSFTPSVQPVQTNDHGFMATSEGSQNSLHEPLLNTDPSAPPPEYSINSGTTGYSPSNRN